MNEWQKTLWTALDTIYFGPIAVFFIYIVYLAVSQKCFPFTHKYRWIDADKYIPPQILVLGCYHCDKCGHEKWY